MSISWSRIFPNGSSNPNAIGIAYYKALFAALKTAGIEPKVVLYSLDMPMYLVDENGWLNPKIIEEFKEYARTCFQNFGNQVKSS